MTKVVFDTNIIVSAALSPNGNPAKILSMVAFKNDIQVYYNDVILAEYNDVLSRLRLNIPIEIQNRIINAINRTGIIINPVISVIFMPDETDRVFYDTAKVCGAILITGNTKHFPIEPFIMTPVEFLHKMGIIEKQ